MYRSTKTNIENWELPGINFKNKKKIIISDFLDKREAPFFSLQILQENSVL